MTAEKVIAVHPFMGDGEHKIAALTSDGRLFERKRDNRGINYHPGDSAPFEWTEIATPGPRLVAFCPFIGDGGLVVVTVNGHMFERVKLGQAVTFSEPQHAWRTMSGPLDD
jgi:hypothetical protein